MGDDEDDDDFAYGKTWKDIRTFDDIIDDEKERKIIKAVEQERSRSCPDLGKEGEFFYYCACRSGKVTDKKPSLTNPIYHAHVSFAELQLFCKGDYEKCVVYRSPEKQEIKF